MEKIWEEDALWSVFSGMFSGRAVHDTSYKYGFFKAVLDSNKRPRNKMIHMDFSLFQFFSAIKTSMFFKFFKQYSAINGQIDKLLLSYQQKVIQNIYQN